jgi:transcriptional regulator with XRE-family HTH domain
MKGEFDAKAFHAALDAHRDSKEMSWKEVAEETGVGASTLTRMSQGKCPDANGLAVLLRWSGLKADDFIRGDMPKGRKQPEPMAQITALLRADPSLKKESAEALEQIIKAAYKRFKDQK